MALETPGPGDHLLHSKLDCRVENRAEAETQPGGELAASHWVKQARAGANALATVPKAQLSRSSHGTSARIGTKPPRSFFITNVLTSFIEQLSFLSYLQYQWPGRPTALSHYHKSFCLHPPSLCCSKARCHQKIGQQGSAETLPLLRALTAPGWCPNSCLMDLVNGSPFRE